MARKTASDFFEKEAEETVNRTAGSEEIKTETGAELEKLNSEVPPSEGESDDKSEVNSIKCKSDHEEADTQVAPSIAENEDSLVTSDNDKDSAAALVLQQQPQNSALTPEQEAYYAQYAQYTQYMQQYQQYYSQYYPAPAAAPPTSTIAAASDPVYDYYTGATSSSASAPATSFESTRANRQMTAYFDPNKFQAVLSPEMQASQRAQKEQQQAKLTAKDIEAFKKRKIEKKKGKNRWFYE